MQGICKPYSLIFLVLLNGLVLPGATAQTGEHIHVHFNKDIYLPGETVWFTAYVFQNSRPSGSTNLYAGVYDAEGSLITEQQYPVFRGTSNGSFNIPGNFTQEGMQLRLLTKRMQLTDSSKAFVQPIMVYQRSRVSNTAEADSLRIQVFPEGGNLVADVINYITVSASSPENLSAFPEGIAFMEDNLLLDSVYLNKDGFARFQFMPGPNKKYHLQWQSGKLLLPEAQTNSASLHTETTGGKIYYNIQKNTDIPRLVNLTLEIRDAEDILYSEHIAIKEKKNFTNSIPSDSFPPGMLSVNLMDAEKNLLQQKFLLNQKQQPKPVIRVVEYSPAPKGRNRIEIDMNDSARFLLSASVTDENFMQDETAVSIADELLAGTHTSFIAHHTEDPKAIDYFLQTQSLKENLKNTIPVTDNYLDAAFTYDAKKEMKGRPVLSVIVVDSINGKQYFSIDKNEKDVFLQDGLIFYDAATIYYKLNMKDNAVYFRNDHQATVLHPKKIGSWKNTGKSNLFLQKVLPDSAIVQYKIPAPDTFTAVKTIENVTVKSAYVNPDTRRLMEIDEKYASGMYRGLTRGVQFNLIDDPRADFFPDIYSYLAYKIPGVRVERVKIPIGGTDSVYAKAFVSVRGGGQEKLVLTLLIDEMESTFDMLETIPVSQIGYVKAVTGIFIGSSFTSNAGAIMIYTKKWDDYPAKIAGIPMLSKKVKGYNIPATFTKIDYTRADTSGTNDYRTALYWNPSIATSEANRKITIEYFNNDLCKKPVLVLKGINDQGQVFEIRKSIQ